MRKIFCIAAAFAAALLPGCNENENNSVAVTDISLDRIVLEMVEGDTATLHASLLPAEAAGSETVEWESSDLSVATVDEGGKVTAVAPGQPDPDPRDSYRDNTASLWATDSRDF